MQNRPRAPSWLPRTLLWVLLATQPPLWGKQQKLFRYKTYPSPKSSSWYITGSVFPKVKN